MIVIHIDAQHEVGHLRDHSTRYGLVTAWLTAPWRGAAFAFGGLLRLIVRNLPTAKAALVLVPVLVVAAGVQAVQQHAWAPLAVLLVLAVVLTVHPVADAALSRASDRLIPSGQWFADSARSANGDGRRRRAVQGRPRLPRTPTRAVAA